VGKDAYRNDIIRSADEIKYDTILARLSLSLLSRLLDATTTSMMGGIRSEKRKKKRNKNMNIESGIYNLIEQCQCMHSFLFALFSPFAVCELHAEDGWEWIKSLRGGEWMALSDDIDCHGGGGNIKLYNFIKHRIFGMIKKHETGGGGRGGERCNALTQCGERKAENISLRHSRKWQHPAVSTKEHSDDAER
jgi:hypothetical protein